VLLGCAVLRIKGVACVTFRHCFPLVETIDLVQCNTKRSVFLSQQLNRLFGLRFETVHDINNKDSHITKRATSTSKVGKRLVAGCINNKEAGNLKVEWLALSNDIQMLLQVLPRKVSSTNLLSDTTCFASLDICFSKFVKNQGFASIYVAQNTDDWAAQISLFLAFETLGFKFSSPLRKASLPCLGVLSHIREQRTAFIFLLGLFFGCSLAGDFFSALLFSFFFRVRVITLIQISTRLNSVSRLLDNRGGNILNCILPIIELNTVVLLGRLLLLGGFGISLFLLGMAFEIVFFTRVLGGLNFFDFFLVGDIRSRILFFVLFSVAFYH